MPPTPLRQEDYLAIEAAVMETARGRWFLSEYARRNRNSDTDTLLAAIDKLEKTVVRERAPATVMDRVKVDLADMAGAIERTKREIAQIKHENNDGSERFERASLELDAIVSQTESATGEILGAAEKIQEYAWTLREMGADEDKCNELDMEATNIYMSCSFQDLTGQRIKKIVDAMRYVESRINSMIDIWGFESHTVEVDANHHRSHDERPDAHLLNGPQFAGEGVEQSDVDLLLNNADHGPADQGDIDAMFDAAPEEADQGDIDAMFDAAPEEADQDDIDAMFDAAPEESDQGDIDAMFDAAPEEADQDDIDAMFDAAPAEAVDDVAVPGAPDLSAEAGQDDIDAMMADSAIAPNDDIVAAKGNIGADVLDMEDLDWADAKVDAAGADDATEMVDEGDADVFASADLDNGDDDSDETVSPAAKADVFAGVTIDNVEADIFAAAPEDEEDLEALEGSIADLRDRVADFS
ncbi:MULTISPECIES: protein phosphatase CheZ [Cohaesibacter]|uniref:protein phosphatase CheZ n=1 Tax=Cohaesibacter TaxID=655352 RepID=UPI00130050FE|nr:MULTISPECIES: protein phosphatase CheZ [Cohaesibacter]